MKLIELIRLLDTMGAKLDDEISIEFVNPSPCEMSNPGKCVVSGVWKFTQSNKTVIAIIRMR